MRSAELRLRRQTVSGYGRTMHERRPAPQEHVDERSERDRRLEQQPDARQLASQMGNVAFTALARSVARQSTDEIVEFPPDYIGPEHGGPRESDGIVEFPPDYIGPEHGGPRESDGIVEFPPDYIGPEHGGPRESDGIVEFPPDYIGPDN